MNKNEVQQTIKEHGLDGFIGIVESLLNGYDLPNGARAKLRPEQISLKELWEALCPAKYWGMPMKAIQEAGALDPTGFPTLTEKLLSTAMIDGYNEHPPIADRLVPNSIEPRTLTERIPGITTMEGPKSIVTGERYPRIGFGDKYVDFEQALFNKKEGFAVEITEEIVRFDQTNMIVEAARTAGRTLQTERERRTVRAVMGIGLDTGTVIGGVYFPNSVDTPLYSAALVNYRTNTAPIYNHPGQTADSKLENYTDVQEVMTVQAQNMKDDRMLGTERPIVWMPDRVLAPTALASTAANIFQAMGVTVIQPFTASTNNEIRTQLDNNALASLFNGQLPTPIASVYMDEVSSTGWAMFDSRQTFVRINIFPFATFRSPSGYGWNEDVLFAIKVREWSRIVAKEYRSAIFSTGA